MQPGDPFFLPHTQTIKRVLLIHGDLLYLLEIAIILFNVLLLPRVYVRGK